MKYFVFILILFSGWAQGQGLDRTELVAYYSFSGNPNGTGASEIEAINRGAALTEDREGNSSNAYFFDGRDFLDLGARFDLANRAISFQFKAEKGNKFAIASPILLEQSPNERGQFALQVRLEEEYVVVENGRNFCKGKLAKNGTWNEIIIREEVTKLTVYLNGEELEEKGNSKPMKVEKEEANFILGASHNRRANHFQGSIDELKIYKIFPKNSSPVKASPPITATPKSPILPAQKQPTKKVKEWSKEEIAAFKKKKGIETKKAPVIKDKKVEETPPVIEEVPLKKESSNTLEDRQMEVTKDLKVKSKSVTISIYDDGVIDGDTISLYFNNVSILSSYGLQKKEKVIKIELEDGPNQFIIFAESMGRIQPNTAVFTIDDGTKKRRYHLSSDMKSNAVLRVSYSK